MQHYYERSWSRLATAICSLDSDARYRVNFPKSAARLTELIWVLRIIQEPTRDADPSMPRMSQWGEMARLKTPEEYRDMAETARARSLSAQTPH